VAVFVWRPGVPDAVIGPTTQVVAPPAVSGSLNGHEVVLT
jgi:hypothetical protein